MLCAGEFSNRALPRIHFRDWAKKGSTDCRGTPGNRHAGGGGNHFDHAIGYHDQIRGCNPGGGAQYAEFRLVERFGKNANPSFA